MAGVREMVGPRPAALGAVGRVLNKIGGGFINAIRLNTVAMRDDCGTPLIVKRRNPFGRHITPIANWFFRCAKAPIAFWPETAQWQQGEVSNFHLVNPQYQAAADGRHSIREEKLPGESLWVHLKRGTLTRGMCRAAGAEYRRAHGLWSEIYGAPWSHGDAAMRNVLYDVSTRRAR